MVSRSKLTVLGYHFGECRQGAFEGMQYFKGILLGPTWPRSWDCLLASAF